MTGENLDSIWKMQLYLLLVRFIKSVLICFVLFLNTIRQPVNYIMKTYISKHNYSIVTLITKFEEYKTKCKL